MAFEELYTGEGLYNPPRTPNKSVVDQHNRRGGIGRVGVNTRIGRLHRTIHLHNINGKTLI